MHDILFRTGPKTYDLGIVPGIDDIRPVAYDAGLTSGYGSPYVFMPVGVYRSIGEALRALVDTENISDQASADPEPLSHYAGGYYKIDFDDAGTAYVDFGDPFVFGRISKTEDLYDHSTVHLFN